MPRPPRLPPDGPHHPPEQRNAAGSDQRRFGNLLGRQKAELQCLSTTHFPEFQDRIAPANRPGLVIRGCWRTGGWCRDGPRTAAIRKASAYPELAPMTVKRQHRDQRRSAERRRLQFLVDHLADRRPLRGDRDSEDARAVWWRRIRLGYRLPAESGVIVIDGRQP